MIDETKILIIGSKGQLGLALQYHYPNAKAVDMGELDISNPAAVENYDWSNIKIVINAAAYTNVDGAETPEGRVTAWKVNALAIKNLTKVCLKHDLLLVHISTDYVFDGTQDNHSEDEPLSPLNVYGASKAGGDTVIDLLPNYYIIRTSWVIGAGKNFVRTMLELGKKGVNPSVVSDQTGRLTFTGELVRAADHLLNNKSKFGVYNVSNDGEIVSWADITRKIFQLASYNNTVSDVTTEEYYKGKKGIAQRPIKSALDLSKIKATGFNPRDWHESLKLYIEKEIGK